MTDDVTPEATPAAPRRPWRSTLTSFATLVTGEGIARVFGLVTVLVLARELGPAGFGVVAFGVALVTWIGLVSDAGTEMLSTRDVAREPERFRQIAEAVVGLRLVLGVTCAAALALGALAFARSNVNAEVYALFALVLPATALNLRWITLGVRGARLIAVGNVAGQLVLMIGVLVVVAGHEDVTRVPLLYVLAELVYAVVILVLLVPRYGLLRPRVDRVMWRTTLRGGLPLMVSAFSRGLLLTFDLLVITVLVGPGDAGQYSAAARPVLFVITAIGLFYFSFVASYSTLHGREAATLLRTSVRTSALASTGAALLLAALCVPLVDLLYGARYEEAAAVLAVMACRIPPSAVSAPYNGVLLATGHQHALMRNNVVGAVANVVAVLGAAALGSILLVATVSVLSTVLVLALNMRTAVAVGAVPSIRATILRERAG